MTLKKTTFGGLALSLALSPAAWSHGPTPQKVIETVEIAAPIEKVWDAVKDFGAIATWNKALTASEATGSQAGATRTLTFKNGEKLTEELDVMDAEKHEISYRMTQPNVKALPASSYSVIFSLAPSGSGTKVEWKSRLYRGDTGNTPPENLSDEAASAAMHDFFKAGLEGLKGSLGGG